MTQLNNFSTRFKKNFIWLFLLDNLSYVFSFISMPILISKFDYKVLGSVFTIQAIVLALATLSNYSLVFYIPTVSKKISDDKIELNNLWNIAISSRTFFSLFFTIVSSFIVFVFYNEYVVLWLLSLPVLLPKIINPALLCNALEKNNIVLKIGFFSKLFFLICIFFSNNFYLINFFLGISEFIVILFFFKKIDASFWKLRLVSHLEIANFIKGTFNLFLVNLFSMLKPASVLPMISHFFGTEYATVYTLAEKAINVVRSVAGSIFVSFFPIYNKEKINISFTSLKNISIVFVFSVLTILVVWFLSPMIIYVLNDFNSSELATQVLRILSFSIPMFFIIIPLFSYLLNNKKWNLILIFSIIQLTSFYGLLYCFHNNISQIALGFVLSEYVLLFCYYTYVISKERKREIIFF